MDDTKDYPRVPWPFKPFTSQERTVYPIIKRSGVEWHWVDCQWAVTRETFEEVDDYYIAGDKVFVNGMWWEVKYWNPYADEVIQVTHNGRTFIMLVRDVTHVVPLFRY